MAIIQIASGQCIVSVVQKSIKANRNFGLKGFLIVGCVFFLLIRLLLCLEDMREQAVLFGSLDNINSET